MPIEGFNFEDFAKNLAQQASGVIPPDIDENGKAYIINLVFNYCMVAGEALDKDTTITLNAQQASIICQFIGEWTFHKAIDIIRSNLPIEVRDEVLQKVAFTVFEIAKLAILKDIPMQQIIMLVEQHVKKAFDEIVKDLTTRGVINDDLAENAINQSNIDDMAKQQQEAEQEEEASHQPQQHGSPDKKQSNRILKLASLALLLKNMPVDKVKSIIKKFNPKDADLILQYIQMPDLQVKLDSTIAIKCLREIKQNLPKTKKLNASKLNSKLNAIVNNSDKNQISAIIEKERTQIKKLINSQEERENFHFPPHITAILCNYLEEKAALTTK